MGLQTIYRYDCSVYLVDIETVLPEIIPSSPIHRVDEGSRLTILCQASTGDFLHLAWQRRSRPKELLTTLTRNKHNITSTLTIEHAQLEDADEYVCYGYGWTANETKISVITVNVTGKNARFLPACTTDMIGTHERNLL